MRNIKLELLNTNFGMKSMLIAFLALEQAIIEGLVNIKFLFDDEFSLQIKIGLK